MEIPGGWEYTKYIIQNTEKSSKKLLCIRLSGKKKYLLKDVPLSINHDPRKGLLIVP